MTQGGAWERDRDGAPGGAPGRASGAAGGVRQDTVWQDTVRQGTFEFLVEVGDRVADGYRLTFAYPDPDSPPAPAATARSPRWTPPTPRCAPSWRCCRPWCWPRRRSPGWWSARWSRPRGPSATSCSGP
ncbi:hypothetical protein ACFQ9X_06945 [Catenulispora yoronensis]